jgi:phage major capsid protein, HK97 family
MKITALVGMALAVLIAGVCVAHAFDVTTLLPSADDIGHAMLASCLVPAANLETHALALHPRTHARARGVVLSPRNDAGDATKILNEMKATFEAFKAENNKELADIKKGMGDVVQSEKVERINAQIGELQAAIDQVNASIKAANLGGGGDSGEADPDRRAYAAGFDRYFRRGVDNGLSDLGIKAKVSTDSDPDGGYVVPTQVEQTIDRVLGKVSTMRKLARTVTISTGVYKKLVGQGAATSGWVGEKSARGETETPKLSGLDFPAMELYAMPAATQTLLDDASVDIAAWLADEVNIEFAEQEGTAFITGDGVNKPRGLLGYGTVADANWAWGKLGFIASGVAAALTDETHNGGDALIDLTYALKQGYRQNAGWIMNRKTASTVRKLKDGNDNYLWQPGLTVGQPSTLLGYAVADDDNMDDIGAGKFPIGFGDFQRGYLIVDRQGVRVLRDPFSSKPYVLFYTTKRVGGGVQNFQAIKLLKISA